MKKSTTCTAVIALGAGASLLSIASLASVSASVSAAFSDPATVQAADDPKPNCGPLDSLPGGPCSTDETGDGRPLPSRNPSDRNIKTDILQADWTRQ
ncbi:hypothetical protein [Streptomyces sp. NPDC001404]|uniref:hypothetical protein n=1 Tax=Streptomyces sp. NPDC001404 TaxID=3364571 RepID=UPI0036B1BE4C